MLLLLYVICVNYTYLSECFLRHMFDKLNGNHILIKCIHFGFAPRNLFDSCQLFQLSHKFQRLTIRCAHIFCYYHLFILATRKENHTIYSWNEFSSAIFGAKFALYLFDFKIQFQLHTLHQLMYNESLFPSIDHNCSSSNCHWTISNWAHENNYGKNIHFGT